ncbi:MAG: hypothetical protein AAF974_01195, partial [Cyanobacteria bacterium P01_E01_bin.34]
MFFWAKPADSLDWEEIPATGGLLVAGTYSIAVQSPQPHFTIMSNLRHFFRLEDGSETLRWQTEQSSCTNDEGVGWIVQDLELTAGRWQISCHDADLVAELFGESADNSIMFQVIDLKGARLSAGPYGGSTVSLPAMASPAISSVVESPSLADMSTVSVELQSADTNIGHMPPPHNDSQSATTDPQGSASEYGYNGGTVSYPQFDRILANASDCNEIQGVDRDIKQDGDRPTLSAGTSSQLSPYEPTKPVYNTPSPNPPAFCPDDAVTEICAPVTAPDREFVLNCTEFTAFPGESITISGLSKRSGELMVTALTKNSAPIQESQRLVLPASAPFASFSVQLTIPPTWSEDSIVGLAELHPDDGSASLSYDFTVSAEPCYSGYSNTPSSHATSFVEESWPVRTSPAEISQVEPVVEERASDLQSHYQQLEYRPELADIQQLEDDQHVDDLNRLENSPHPTIPPSELDQDKTLAFKTGEESLPNSQLTKTGSCSEIFRAAWSPELTDEDTQAPEIAFASLRSPDRTLQRLMALMQSAVAATAARTRFQQVQSAFPRLDDGIMDGIVGEVKVVPARGVPLGGVLPADAGGPAWGPPKTTEKQGPGRGVGVLPSDSTEPSEYGISNTTNENTPASVASKVAQNSLISGTSVSPSAAPGCGDSGALLLGHNAFVSTDVEVNPLPGSPDGVVSDLSGPLSMAATPSVSSARSSQPPAPTSAVEPESLTDASSSVSSLSDSDSFEISPSAESSQSTNLSIDIPRALRSGDLVSVVMKSKSHPHPACVKLWVIDSFNQKVVDGPR